LIRHDNIASGYPVEDGINQLQELGEVPPCTHRIEIPKAQTVSSCRSQMLVYLSKESAPSIAQVID
jgi:hypothetical protein